ncbi:MAG: polymer-forming cytoskeletal protein [Anaerolineales bacterium]|nr:polymer-forming cytoskeletal protein [Anaerolineales bacterium]MCZ2123254.1 polymer-forming cytoskeletal protein [Anaerolineales bacterium]
MFKRNTTPTLNQSKNESAQPVQAVERITSVLGAGVIWHGSINGSGGVRIEGAFEGEIALRGMLVVGETGRVTCQNVRANTVIVAGAVRGNITTQKLEIRASGRVWGDVVTSAFATEEGAFLRGQIRTEETVELNLEPAPETTPAEAAAEETIAQTPIQIPPPEVATTPLSEPAKAPRKKKSE